MDCFPLEVQERDKLPRQYVINVIYTCAGQPFREWVNQLVDRRHEEVADKKQLYIELDPEIAAVFNSSKAVSTSQGSSFNLLKASAKRRRSKKLIEEEKLQEELKQAQIQEKLEKYDKMNALMPQAIEAGEKLATYNAMIDQLKQNGLMYLKDDGQAYMVENFAQYQQLKRQRHDESIEAEEMSQQNQQLSESAISKERLRPSQQLELNDQMMN